MGLAFLSSYFYKRTFFTVHIHVHVIRLYRCFVHLYTVHCNSGPLDLWQLTQAARTKIRLLTYVWMYKVLTAAKNVYISKQLEGVDLSKYCLNKTGACGCAKKCSGHKARVCKYAQKCAPLATKKGCCRDFGPIKVHVPSLSLFLSVGA